MPSVCAVRFDDVVAWIKKQGEGSRLCIRPITKDGANTDLLAVNVECPVGLAEAVGPYGLLACDYGVVDAAAEAEEQLLKVALRENVKVVRGKTLELGELQIFNCGE